MFFFHADTKMKRWVVFLLAFLVLILLLAYTKTRSCYPMKQGQEIPKILWSFWDSDEIPPFVQKCIDSWKKFNPDYTVNFMTKSTLGKYLGEEEAQNIINWKFNDSPQRLSDLVRLSAVSKFGGVWLDASVVCFKSFNWLQEEGSDCILFSIKELSKDPTIESWFIAAIPEHPYVIAWNKEFRGIDQYSSVDEYIKISGTNQDAIAYNVNYLVVYLCARKVFHDYGEESVKILSASDGPYEYMVKGGIKSLCDSRNSFAKFRKDERAEMTPEVESCIFNPGEKQDAPNNN